ncbi:MAG: histidine--tRNA ligase [Candidatus Campbellbacteria bacterium]|nr:histidine--tRNA ligase [Candidatus Campbellbacteria bacterium]
MTEKSKKVSTEPYKGVRDFYPKDMAVQNYIFDVWRKVLERYGYEEYNASILEPAELYRSKTSEEIVNEQTYTFTDRGGREVTLRPEMTPTVARMVAGCRRELPTPLRWFSIPNCFRYERPQRGRTREFWQLNADIFGVSGIEADTEIISLAHDIMTAFGAKDSDFQIQVNNRKLLDTLPSSAIPLLDKKGKMSAEEFATEWKKISDTPFALEADTETIAVIETLKKRAISNVIFNPSVVRGFAYYSGIVFEIFDTHADNNRSIFGGGRYDNLLEMFGDEKVPAVGFGMGDVIMRDFLDTHGLLPKIAPSATVMLCPISSEYADTTELLAKELRNNGINVAMYYGDKKIGDQIKVADKKHIPYIVCIGEEEQKTSRYTLKELVRGEETTGTVAELSKKLSA